MPLTATAAVKASPKRQKIAPLAQGIVTLTVTMVPPAIGPPIGNNEWTANNECTTKRRLAKGWAAASRSPCLACTIAHNALTSWVLLS